MRFLTVAWLAVGLVTAASTPTVTSDKIDGLPAKPSVPSEKWDKMLKYLDCVNGSDDPWCKDYEQAEESLDPLISPVEEAEVVEYEDGTEDQTTRPAIPPLDQPLLPLPGGGGNHSVVDPPSQNKTKTQTTKPYRTTKPDRTTKPVSTTRPAQSTPPANVTVPEYGKLPQPTPKVLTRSEVKEFLAYIHCRTTRFTGCEAPDWLRRARQPPWSSLGDRRNATEGHGQLHEDADDTDDLMSIEDALLMPEGWESPECEGFSECKNACVAKGVVTWFAAESSIQDCILECASSHPCV
ncbi:hypothetical protein VP1G_06770 [Cytospora mali]|uniref:Uncharacterized protein n=1 Tax=Cytospora mali TaxID=578113 RepID=A0A194V6L1_CYTMA|nr:hypothetical protein VP1G_06770 [Valsa mali var. pyri (nom. inval.)]